MTEPNISREELEQRIREKRFPEALLLFLKKVANKTWMELTTEEMAWLDIICQRALPELLDHHVLWLVKHSCPLRRMLDLLIMALQEEYYPAATLDQIAWLRCLLAIREAMDGRIERVHAELCLVQETSKTEPVLEPNGVFHQQIQTIELTERNPSDFLKQYFAAYLEYLRRIRQYDLANHLESRIGRLLGLIARDEKRPGVVQALFFDPENRIGHARFVHVAMERILPDEGENITHEEILYSRREQGKIEPAMKDAATCARAAVDAYLKQSGYPDGLTEKRIRWEIANLEGDAADSVSHFQGGSIALPLAVAIVSEYLVKPVPNDVALTGSITPATVRKGRILPVDGVPEKVKHAVLAGCRLIYIPAANLPELEDKPALRHLIAEHDTRVVPAETLDQVCKELFPPEGSGRLRDTLKDTAANLKEILFPGRQRRESAVEKSPHRRYRLHVLTCCVIMAVLVFLEGWRLYKAFAPGYPAPAAWCRIITSAAVAFAGMAIGFALPAACLRQGKTWSWYAGTKILGVCLGVTTLLIGPILPDFTSISRIYNSPPAAGLMKDMFFIWIFGWAIVLNTFNAVAALEHLIARRQFVTARTCLRWDSPLEARLPIRCFYFDWKWGMLVIAVFTAILMGFELNYYASLKMGTAAGYWETFLGLGRDLLLLAAITEVAIFYKPAVANIRKALT